MKKLLILTTALLFASCGLVSKYSNGQHDVYAKMLSPEEKEQINQRGEITKDIFFDNPNLYMGTLRILKTDNPGVFNFVEVGQWVDWSKLANSGKTHNLEFKDTLNCDNLGNILSRFVYYEEEDGKFMLGERWTSRQVDNSTIRHIERFRNGILISENDLKLLEFEKPKSGLQKQKQKTGTRKDYSPDGKLFSTTTYDENGKKIKKEKVQAVAN